MLLNSLSVCERQCCLFVYVFPVENIAVHVYHCLHALGVGWSREGVTLVFVWTPAFDAELGSSVFSSLLLPTPSLQRHSNILRVWANCAQRGHSVSHCQQPAAREKSERGDSASLPRVPGPPWPRTAGTETVGVSNIWGDFCSLNGTGPLLSASGDEEGQGLLGASLQGWEMARAELLPVGPEEPWQSGTHITEWCCGRGLQLHAGFSLLLPDSLSPPLPSIWTAPTANLQGLAGPL